MNKDQKILSEAYVSMSGWDQWLSMLRHTWNEDGTVDVDGDVILYEKKLRNIPFNFGTVTGYFMCDNNKLESLKGAPHTVGNGFSCCYCYLRSLKGGPQNVTGEYACSANLLDSLEYSPTIVHGDFSCFDNPKITSLKGAPKIIEGLFDFRNNKLTSLEGLPKAESYHIAPLTSADAKREWEKQELEKRMSPTAKAAWGSDIFTDL